MLGTGRIRGWGNVMGYMVTGNEWVPSPPGVRATLISAHRILIESQKAFAALFLEFGPLARREDRQEYFRAFREMRAHFS